MRAEGEAIPRVKSSGYSYQAPLKLIHRLRPLVMPTKVGIHDFPKLPSAKSWMAGLRPP
jgi:hypothetical protein